MYMNDCVNQGIVREYVVNYLISQGLPCRRKFKNDGLLRRMLAQTERKNTNVVFKMKDKDGVKLVRVYDRKVFGVALRKLEMQNVKLKTGQILPVPLLVHDLCEYIVEHIEVEGIFRKAGSTSRQAEMKLKINGRKGLATEEIDVIDVAAILKYFLRQLPESLVPEAYHKLFAACYDSYKGEEYLLLAILLLPIENLNLLTYLTQFFAEVEKFSSENKMTAYNLSICLAPNIFQSTQFSAEEFSKFTGILTVLIERASRVGKLTDELQKAVRLPRGFNTQPKDSPLTRFLMNVVKGLSIMTC